jgi:hypothetical protein
MDNRFEERVGKMMLVAMLVLFSVSQHSAFAAEKEDAKGDDAKMISGMSIVGNTEAPKSLFIVPWKSSEIGFETTLTSGLDDVVRPVDKEVFMREIDFYETRHEE